jgi:TRAP-type C4-dicarboxylate transport system permease small subunit
VRRAVDVVVMCFLLILLYYSAQKTIQNIPQSMMEFPVSVAWTYLALPIGFVYMLLDCLLILIYGYHPFARQEELTQE